MIRRTFALAGAAVLALGVTGLAGPAAADDNNIQQQLEEVVINEVGVDMVDAPDPDSQDVDGSFIELANTTGSMIELENWELSGCTASTSFSIVAFGQDDNIAAGATERFLIADDDYELSEGGHQPDVVDNSDNIADLIHSDGGVLLRDDSTTPLEDGIKWGDTVHTDCFSSVQAATTPTATQSLHRDPMNGAVRGDPTPESQLGDKVG